jgi:hypothetical protein
MSLQLKTIEQDSKKQGNNFGRLPDGPVHARIVSVVDFGLQPQTDWQTGEAKPSKKTVMITFETPSERIEYEDKEGNKVNRPRWISKEYILSLQEKAALTALVKAVKPDIAALDELLNQPCLVTVGSTKTGNAKVSAVAPPMKGFEVGELENDSFHFDFDDPDMELFNSLPEWMQNKIKDAENYNGFANSEQTEQDEF